MSELSDLQIVALTLWAEARNQPIEGIIAVANVIKNRLKRGGFGKTWTAVCLAPKQFSCWLSVPGDKNHDALVAMSRVFKQGEKLPQSLDECVTVASAVMGEHFRDNTKGSAHYITHVLFVSEKRPAWTNGQQPAVSIGDHVFFNAIR